jgi:hypothetical protein
MQDAVIEADDTRLVRLNTDKISSGEAFIWGEQRRYI